jgi:hypothetical protein
MCVFHTTHINKTPKTAENPKHHFHVDLLPFIRPGGKTVGMHE